MLALKYWEIDTPFVYPFSISKGAKTHQPALIVSLQQGTLEGFGEAPAISYYNVTTQNMVVHLQAKQAMLERYALTEPKRFWHFLHHLFPGENFLVAALDIAAWDLYARRLRQPLFKCLGIQNWHNPITDYTIGIDDSKVQQQRMQACPWPIYKIKMSSAAQIDHIRYLRQHSNALFRVDANESLSYEDTLRLLPELHKLGVEILEQPLPSDEWEAMAALKSQSEIVLMADESCVQEADLVKCAHSFHSINIKLTKCGGITPALRMMAEARNLGLKIMLGCMNETAVGTAALVHLSPLADYLDADGPLLLKDVPLQHLKYDNGTIILEPSIGLGETYTG